MSFDGENRSLIWIHDPNNPRVLDAIHSHKCEVCKAPKGQNCHNSINPGADLPSRVIHYARLEG